MNWDKAVTDYEFYVYDGSQGGITALAKKDLYVTLEDGKKVLREMFSLEGNRRVGELDTGDTVVIVFDTVLILKRKRYQPKTAEIMLSRIADRLEHIETMMEDML